MKIGFNLLLWSGFITEEHHKLLQALKDTGYDGVEIPIFDGDTDHYQKLGKVLDDIGLERTAVTVIPDEAHSLVSVDADCRAAGLKRLKWAIDCCEAAGVERMIGPFHQPLAVFTGEGPTESERAHAAECHHEAAEHAQKAGVALSIEYLNRFECYFLTTMQDAADYVRRVDHPNFHTMYDSFHANIEEKDPVGVIKTHQDVIRHVHISENDRGTPGRGHVDFPSTFAALKEIDYDGWLTIEAFGRALPELAAATRVWRDLSTSPEQVYTEGIELIQKHWN
ncbi:MAG: sugar phosphate isomerase/epimerase [Phycisphaeraceae bacterium]